MAVRTWRSRPLDLIIMEALMKKGAMTDEELLNLLREMNDDLSYATLNQKLMKMEVQGQIHVSSLKKDKRRVELKKPRERPT